MLPEPPSTVPRRPNRRFITGYLYVICRPATGQIMAQVTAHVTAMAWALLRLGRCQHRRDDDKGDRHRTFVGDGEIDLRLVADRRNRLKTFQRTAGEFHRR